jgi:hypothetical protein
MTQQFFNARELFQMQVPVYEPDRITPVYASSVREMLHVSLCRMYFGLRADAEVVSP